MSARGDELTSVPIICLIFLNYLPFNAQGTLQTLSIMNIKVLFLPNDSWSFSYTDSLVHSCALCDRTFDSFILGLVSEMVAILMDASFQRIGKRILALKSQSDMFNFSESVLSSAPPPKALRQNIRTWCSVLAVAVLFIHDLDHTSFLSNTC